MSNNLEYIFVKVNHGCGRVLVNPHIILPKKVSSLNRSVVKEKIKERRALTQPQREQVSPIKMLDDSIQISTHHIKQYLRAISLTLYCFEGTQPLENWSLLLRHENLNLTSDVL